MSFEIIGFEKLKAAGPDNEQAFTDFVNANFPNALKFAESQARNKYSDSSVRARLEVEAAVTDSFYDILKKIPEIYEETVSNLFKTILKRRMLDQVRSVLGQNRNSPQQIPVSGGDTLKNDKDISWENIVAEKENHRIKTLLAALAAIETVLILAERAINCIKGPQTRDALRLFYIEGLSNEEIRQAWGLRVFPVR